MLLSRYHRWLSVLGMSKTNRVNQLPTLYQGRFDPVPANPKVAVTSKPMGGDMAALA